MPLTRANPIPASNNQRSMANAADSETPSNCSGPRLAIALGDPAGIGAEVTLKALALPRLQGLQPTPLLVGCRRWLERTYDELRQRSDTPLCDPASLAMIDLPLAETVQPGRSTPACGEASFQWLTQAVHQVQHGHCQALVTAPIAKASWHAAGHAYPGQTERLAELSGSTDAAMLFTARSAQGWRLNTLLATTHIPLAAVPDALNADGITARLDTLLTFCRRFSPHPRLAVAGLNPHAGEAGALGDDEQTWLQACLNSWRTRHPQVQLEGPLPPDTCWLNAARAWRNEPGAAAEAADGYLALYHDQGLIPVKLLAFDAAVNTTLGLPFLRTSPDHGTGFSIAGRGVARPESMAAAIETALELG
jgi:4-hydroxythreonine-4-phosphate dehydrogenase